MSDLLMDLADCGSPERLIQVILKHHPDWSPPIPLETLAAAVNIVEIRELDTTAFEGALITDLGKTRGAILHRPGVQTGRRRFTIAHELGHFLIPTHLGNRECTPGDMKERGFSSPERRREAEANRFAAGLLMPKPWFERDADRLGDADISHIRILSKSYQTSLEATANRYVELASTPCAIVMSQAGKVRYARRHSDFPALAVNSGDRLPTGSATVLRPPISIRTSQDWLEVDGTVWLRHEWGKASPGLLEQVYVQANGYILTMLAFAELPGNVDAIEEAEEDVVDRLKARFR